MAEEMAIEVEEREGRDAVDLYANSGDVDGEKSHKILQNN